MLEQEFEVVGERIAWPVALVEDSPGTIGAAAAADVLVGYTARPSHGRGNRQLICERGSSGQTSALWDRLFLERGGLGELQFHVENSSRVSKEVLDDDSSSR